MNGAKAQKKQISLYTTQPAPTPAPNRPERDYNPIIDRSLLTLEETCAELLGIRFPKSNDSERIVWEQRFRNIVTNISLALAEIGGTRRFHFHYRHDRKDRSKMLPVLEAPLSLLSHTCELALKESNKKLAGIHDGDMLSAQRKLETAIRNFLVRYRHLVA